MTPLSLAALPLFRRRFESMAVPLSDYSFANNIAWQSRQRYLYATIGDCLCLFALRNGALSMPLPPLGPPELAADALPECIEWMDRNNQGRADWEIRCVNEDLVDALLRAGPPRRPRTIVSTPPDFIYNTAELAELRGACYKSKRNDINQLLRVHPDVCLELLHPEHCLDVADLCERWLAQRPPGAPGAPGAPALDGLAVEEFHAIVYAVTHMDALGLTGLRMLVDGRTEAFILGEHLLPGVGHVLFEKSNRELRGSAQLIFREYARSLTHCPLINTGDALGCSSLARSKESYHPRHLGRKFTVCSLGC
jgi:hypothetical protein